MSAAYIGGSSSFSHISKRTIVDNKKQFEEPNRNPSLSCILDAPHILHVRVNVNLNVNKLVLMQT